MRSSYRGARGVVVVLATVTTLLGALTAAMPPGVSAAVDTNACYVLINHPRRHLVRQIYDAARAAGQGKYRALRGLGSRWTRILWRCWTDRTTYDPAIHHKTEQPG